MILGTQTIFEQKDAIGFDPMASTAFLAGERLKAGPENLPLIMIKDMPFLAFKKWVCKMMTPQKNDCYWVYWVVFDSYLRVV